MTESMYRRSLHGLHQRLAAEVARVRTTLSHPGEKGRGIEDHIRDALSEVLPLKVGVSHGFVVDSAGRQSKQMDIILYDRIGAPRILASPDDQGHQVFPVESTYACGEVKSRLSAPELKDTFDKCTSYKRLVRNAYFEQHATVDQTFRLFGRVHDHWQSIFFCVAVEGTDFKTLVADFSAIVTERHLQPHERVDTVITLDTPMGKKNCLLNAEIGEYTDTGEMIPRDGGIDLLPMEGGVIATYHAKEPWALFIQLLLQYMSQTISEPVDMLKYGGVDAF